MPFLLSRPTHCSVWDRRFSLLLFLFFLDVWGDAIVGDTLLFFLSDNAGASDTTAGLILGAVGLVTDLVATAIGFWLDEWPAAGPLLAPALMKPIGALFLVIMVTVFNVVSPFRLVLLTALMIIVFAPTELLGGMSHSLAIMESTQSVHLNRGAIQTLLFEANYSIANLAIVASRLGIAAARTAWPLPAEANVAVLCLGAILHVVAALAFWWGHRVIGGPFPMTRPRPTERPKLLGGLDCSGGGGYLRRREFWLYLASILAFIGIDFVFYHMSYTLPKYIIRALDAEQYYSLYLTLNPVIIVVLNTVFMVLLPPRPLRMTGKLMLVLMGGTILQAMAVWWLVGSQTQWALVCFLLVFSVGEALAYPRKKPFHVQFAPDHGIAAFQSMAALPLSLVGYAMSWTTGPLLETYCPAVGDCSPALWIWVAVPATLTPLFLLVFAVRQWRQPLAFAPTLHRKGWRQWLTAATGDDD